MGPNLIALAIPFFMLGIGVELDIPEVAIIGRQPPLQGDELRAALLDLGAQPVEGAEEAEEVQGPLTVNF